MAAPGTEPAWVPRQRARKAEKIANVLRSNGCTALEAVRLDADDRAMVETLAEVRQGSAATWRLVIDMLAGSRNPLAACQTCLIGDPQGITVRPLPFGHTGPCANGRWHETVGGAA
jgi:hypothetical protein